MHPSGDGAFTRLCLLLELERVNAWQAVRKQRLSKQLRALYLKMDAVKYPRQAQPQIDVEQAPALLHGGLAVALAARSQTQQSAAATSQSAGSSQAVAGAAIPHVHRLVAAVVSEGAAPARIGAGWAQVISSR